MTGTWHAVADLIVEAMRKPPVYFAGTFLAAWRLSKEAGMVGASARGIAEVAGSSNPSFIVTKADLRYIQILEGFVSNSFKRALRDAAALQLVHCDEPANVQRKGMCCLPWMCRTSLSDRSFRFRVSPAIDH